MILSDEELLRMTVANDEVAFRTLYGRYQKRVYGFALLMSGSSSIADDVTQEVFLALLRHTAHYDAARGGLDSYLHGIARHHVLRILKRHRDLVSLDAATDGNSSPLPQLITQNNPLDELTRRELITAVRTAVLSLPTHYREVIVLCDFQSMTYAQAAVALACSEGTVSSRLNRARAMLGKKLGGVVKLDSTSLSFDLQGCLI